MDVWNFICGRVVIFCVLMVSVSGGLMLVKDICFFCFFLWKLELFFEGEVEGILIVVFYRFCEVGFGIYLLYIDGNRNGYLC